MTPEPNPDQPTAAAWKTSLGVWPIAFAVCILLFLGSLLLPTIGSGPSGRRNTCMNNLRNIAFALDNYYQAQGRYPPAFVPDSSGAPMHSWRVLILPYLDRKDL